MKFYPFYSVVSLSFCSCFSCPIIVDFIKIDNGLLTLQLCLNAKQRISEKRAGDEFTHGDKGREKSHFHIWGLQNGDFFRRKLKCAQLSACPETRNYLILFFLASNSERHHPPQNKIDIFHVAITLFFSPLC